MAGPWFTVRRSGGDWQTLGQVWISDGRRDDVGRIDLRLELVEETDAP